tara:strand:+ start:263 stop:457 length:195 start_codon:yes stop_codon:yes gene_type:complete
MKKTRAKSNSCGSSLSFFRKPANIPFMTTQITYPCSATGPATRRPRGAAHCVNRNDLDITPGVI